MQIVRAVIRFVLTILYRVKIHGLQHYYQAGNRVLIVANHTSFLDALLLAAFLPERVTFTVEHANRNALVGTPRTRPGRLLPDGPEQRAGGQVADPAIWRTNRKAVVFPEGRITQTGSLMKIYQGPGLVADKCHAMVLPVHIEGAQYTPFSRLRGRVRLRWFPPITLTFMPPRFIEIPAHLRGRARRALAAQIVTDMMTEMRFATSNYRRTVFHASLDARHVHGGRRAIVEDVDGHLLTYNQLIRHVFVVGKKLGSN